MKTRITTLLALTMIASAALAEIPQADFAKAMDQYLSTDANIEKVGKALQGFYMKKQQEEQQKQAKAEEEQLEKQLKNPVAVEIGSSPVKGPQTAEITVVEFSDFQCPYCQRGADIMDELVEMYQGNIRIVFKHMPLPFHSQAKPAARAAIAAQKQGKFWEMHDLLFSNQDELTDENFVKFASDLKLDVAKFKADMADPATDKQIEADMAQGNKLGVQGTPGFFVNGVQVRGARPAEYFKGIIDRIKANKK